MIIDQLQQQLTNQFVQDKTALIPLKNLLYDNPSSRHLVCLGEGYHYNWQDLRLHTAHFVQILCNRPTDKQVALVFKSGFLMVCALLALVHCKRKIILPSLQTAEHLADIQPYFSLLFTDNESLANQVESKAISDLYFYQISIIEPFNIERINELLQIEDIPDAQMIDLDNPDLYLFTSGSTGKPKMIGKYFALFDRQITIEYDLLAEKLLGAVMYSTVNHNHLLGLMYRLFFPLVLRMPFRDYSLIMPEQLSNISHPYALISSPAFLRFLDDKLTYPAARVVYSSGGKLPHVVGEKTKSYLNCQLMEFYGSSETGAIAYKYFPSDDWIPLEGIDVQKKENGCLEILSPLLPQNSWYAMEDRVNITAQGFELLGRADRIAKISEKRVSLTQIEYLVLQLSEISEVKALVIRELHRDSVGLVVVLSPDFIGLSTKEVLTLLRNHLRNHIELIALPRRVRLIEFMPLNEQGKLNIKQLEQLFV